MSPRRGEVWLVDFGEPVDRERAGQRPAVGISADGLNEGPSELVLVVPCTTSRRSLPSHIEIQPGESGLAETSYAKCEDLKSVSRRRLVRRMGSVGSEITFEISAVLGILLDL